MKKKIKKCNLLNSKKELKFKAKQEGTYIYLNDVKLDTIDTIIELQI
jgi:alpha-L-fucosidase